MPTQEMPFLKPVEDTVPKVDNAVAVGEDLHFQRRWWRFERAIWIFFLLILVADALGLFGRGWLAKAQRSTPDNALSVKYERIERASTPSVMTITLGPSAIENGAAHLFLSNSITDKLGAQRIAPQPATSVLGNGGITYTFPASTPPAVITISLEPSFPGTQHFTLGIAGAPSINGTVFVVP